MTTGRFILPILLFFSLLLLNCSEDKPSKPAVPATPAASPEQPPQPAPAATSTAPEPYKPIETPAGKTVEELRNNKNNRIGTMPTGKDAELNKTVEAPPTKVEAKKVDQPGSPAYISKKDAILQSEPLEGAAKITALKQYETVYILETKMTDASGKTSDVPQWYKIQRSDGQKGWVQSRFVGLPF